MVEGKPAGKGDRMTRAGNRKAETLINSAECQEHADHYKRLSGAGGISKDRAAVLKNIAELMWGWPANSIDWRPLRGTSKGRVPACLRRQATPRKGRANCCQGAVWR